MAGVDPQMLFGAAPTLTAAPSSGSGIGGGSLSASVTSPHFTVIGLVLVALLVLFLLDRAGFRFAVTVGKR